MKPNRLRPIVILILSCGFLAVSADRPERKVESNTILSERDPKIWIQLPKSVQYIGADRWELYSVADCEVHVFVEADAQKNVQRLYWVQFEGYLPTKPEAKYEYDSPQHSKIGGLDFYVDTWVRANDAATRPGSDREHVQALIGGKAYKIPPGMMYVRLVHLLDEQKRKELMIIYGEDLAPTGLTVGDLSEKGRAYGQWPAIAKGLVDRAQQKILLVERINP
ncbi:MAG TPA: hypothetical protein VKE93_05040 [Candidatus Angelobacter sp.]|nr:hypothetical protein [Candidatus Angelobacter sp.]